MMRILLLAAALMAVSAVAAPGTSAPCAIAAPADGDLKAFAATFFPKADDAELAALAKCLGDPDPTVRDGFAFTLWSEGLRGRHLSDAQMRHALGGLTALAAGPDDAGGYHRPFAVLALSEIARTDRIKPWMSDAELHELALAGAHYLRNVSDHRGFVAGEGWRHGVAHGADLMMQLALNPRRARADVDPMLAAIAAQVAPAGPSYYVHGEARRLVRPLLYLAKRTDIDDAVWTAWFQSLHPDAAPRWKAAYTDTAGLAAVHNSSAFGDAVYVAANEAQDPQIRRLAPLAAGLLKALP